MSASDLSTCTAEWLQAWLQKHLIGVLPDNPVAFAREVFERPAIQDFDEEAESE